MRTYLNENEGCAVKRISHSFPSFDDSCLQSAIKAMESGEFSGLESKIAAEAQLAKFMQVRFAKITSSGFSALQTALVAAGAKAGDRIVIPTVTCPSVYHAICSVGAIPVVVDVGSDIPLLSWDKVARQAGGAFRGIIFPQMFGLTRDLRSFRPESGFLVEDLAQRFTPYISPHADLAVVSFSPTKLLTMGYGGAVVCQEESTSQRISRFLDADHTEYMEDGTDSLPFRIHAPASGFQCAMLTAQLDRYQQIIAVRNSLVEAYDHALGDPERLHPDVPFRYQLIVNNGSANWMASRLRDQGIGAWALGSHLLHRLFPVEGTFDDADRWSQTVLSLPLHEKLTLDDIKEITRLVRRLI